MKKYSIQEIDILRNYVETKNGFDSDPRKNEEELRTLMFGGIELEEVQKAGIEQLKKIATWNNQSFEYNGYSAKVLGFEPDEENKFADKRYFRMPE